MREHSKNVIQYYMTTNYTVIQECNNATTQQRYNIRLQEYNATRLQQYTKTRIQSLHETLQLTCNNTVIRETMIQ